MIPLFSWNYYYYYYSKDPFRSIQYTKYTAASVSLTWTFVPDRTESTFSFTGFAKSFPLKGSLFDSWLAQSVHITTDNMLSQWSLSRETHDPSASLLSDQLLQGEESLLSLMMDHSMKSTWKTPQLGRKTRGASRSRSHRKSVSVPRTGSNVAKGKAPSEERRAAGGKRGARARHLRRRHARSCHTGRPDPPQPPVSKMDSCHISEERGSRDSSANAADAESGRCPQALRLRLPRQGKSRSKSETTELVSALDPETDGYFSDAEQSDSETRSASRKLRFAQLHAGNEEVVRRSVLAS